MTHRSRWATIVVFVATLFATMTAASACDNSKRPPEQTNNVWFCYRDTDTAIVFVHGVLSDNNSAWYNETSEAYWPSLIAEDPTFKDAAIFLGGYPTQIISNEFGLDAAVDTLFKHLRVFKDGHKQPVTHFKRIVFIAHSLGGVVVRRMLMQHPGEFRDHEIGLVLLGSPSKGSNFADLLEPMAVALSIKNEMLEVLKWNSAWLRTFHDDFKRLIADQRLKMAGIELFEANPIGGIEGFQGEGWTGKVKAIVLNAVRADTILAQPIVPLASAGEYWDAVHPVGNTDHFSLVKPFGLNDDVYTQVMDFYANVMAGNSRPGCDPPPSFNVLIDVPTIEEQLVPISIIRDPDDENLPGDADIRPVRPQEESSRYVYLPDPPFPCPGQKLKALITRATGSEGSRTATTARQQPWRLCFKRSKATARKDVRFAKIDCRNPVGDKCAVPVNPVHSGMADSCEESSSLDLVGLVASVQGASEAESATVWVTPSLESILKQPAKERRSYVEFRLVADDLLDLGKATHYEVEVQVNGRVLYFDGWPPERLRKRYRGKGPLVIDFALDSLNMTGEKSGYEAIKVVIRLFADKERLSTLISQRPYASYRHYEEPSNSVMEALSSDIGGTFQWTGSFRPSTGQDRFAVMLLSRVFGSDLRRALPPLTQAKKRLDGLGLKFKAQTVVGRLYPPSPTSKAFGLAFALARDEGRVSVAFPIQEARAICKYIARRLGRLVPKGVAAPDAFIYDFDPALFAAGRGRPRRFAPCRELK